MWDVSSPTRDQTRALPPHPLTVEPWSLNHCTVRLSLLTEFLSLRYLVTLSLGYNLKDLQNLFLSFMFCPLIIT